MFTQTAAMLLIYLPPFILTLTVPMNGWVAILLSAIMGLGWQSSECVCYA
ncbi:MAG: hypothetical protein IPM38_00005 [Ignavibacteria bacterium]|nr:hypothetical protein [Ignavibacteria bacterium]